MSTGRQAGRQAKFLGQHLMMMWERRTAAIGAQRGVRGVHQCAGALGRPTRSRSIRQDLRYCGSMPKERDMSIPLWIGNDLPDGKPDEDRFGSQKNGETGGASSFFGVDLDLARVGWSQRA